MIEAILVIIIFLLLAGVAGLFYSLFHDPFSRNKSVTFDHYKKIKFLKRGGMANVYLAEDIKDGSKVALKIMHETLMEDKDLVIKFLSEGEILESINRKYPNAPIIKIFRHSRENNKSDGIPFLALEFFEGNDLDDEMEKGNLTVKKAIKVVEKVAEALEAAHAEGVIHRDISPGNIMISSNGDNIESLVMIDFGVAKSEYLNKHTPDGSIHGKPPFMSPEQCNNEPLDSRSDIYALGMLFYTLIEGKPPFMDKNPLQVMRMHSEAELPRLSAISDEHLQKVFKKMAAKSKEDRYESIAQFLADFRKFTSQTEMQVVNKEVSVPTAVIENKPTFGYGKKKKTLLATFISIIVISIISLMVLLISIPNGGNDYHDFVNELQVRKLYGSAKGQQYKLLAPILDNYQIKPRYVPVYNTNYNSNTILNETIDWKKVYETKSIDLSIAQ